MMYISFKISEAFNKCCLPPALSVCCLLQIKEKKKHLTYGPTFASSKFGPLTVLKENKKLPATNLLCLSKFLYNGSCLKCTTD